MGFRSAIDLLSARTPARPPILQPWLSGAEINRDGNLRLQYLAGMAVNTSAEGIIYNQILMYRHFPEGLLTVSAELRPSLMSAFERGY